MVILGVVQGLTEFLPVSSTAHLLFAEALLGVPRPGILLESVLHLGTALAAAWLFRDDLLKLLRGLWSTFAPQGRAALATYRRLGWAVVIATAITAVIGLAFESRFEAMFGSLRGTAIQLMISGGLLLLLNRRGTREATDAGAADGVAMGIAQAVAIIPGISRSGTTIVTSTWLGMKPEEAARLSFLVAVPSVAGAGLFGLKDYAAGIAAGYTVAQLLVGFVTAAVFGALAIRWLLQVVRRGRLGFVAAYCIAVGLIVVAVSMRG
ncbi:MAG TPA: undecaprenyl-diphosphate phosphatase [bacterium]|jgi:undecaprenyl-diphosphatase